MNYEQKPFIVYYYALKVGLQSSQNGLIIMGATLSMYTDVLCLNVGQFAEICWVLEIYINIFRVNLIFI